MIRLALLLVMAISQAQPLAAALLCEQHHAAMSASCIGDMSDHQDTPSSHHAPADHDCAAMAACSVAVPAILTRVATTTAIAGEFQLQILTPTKVPPAALRAPPFHPPKA